MVIVKIFKSHYALHGNKKYWFYFKHGNEEYGEGYKTLNEARGMALVCITSVCDRSQVGHVLKVEFVRMYSVYRIIEKFKDWLSERNLW